MTMYPEPFRTTVAQRNRVWKIGPEHAAAPVPVAALALIVLAPGDKSAPTDDPHRMTASRSV